MTHVTPTIEGTRGAHAADFCTALAIAGASLALLVWTSPDFGMVWDEGHTVRRERLLETWVRWLLSPPAGRSRGEAFSGEVLARYWPFGRQEPDGHPPFYAILGLAGWWVSRHHLDPLSAYRLGPMALTAVTIAIVYFHLGRRHGRMAGLTAAGALLSMPRLFAHAHYAHYDMPMSCLWILGQIVFVNCLRSRRWIVPFGILLGLAAATKFTGWFAPLAPIAWVVAFESGPWLWRTLRRPATHASETSVGFAGTKTLLYGLAVGLLVLYLIQPAWWASPWQSLLRFLDSNLSRSETKPIPSMYLGQVYEFSLPWHNTLVLTAITVPVLVCTLGSIGIGAVAVRRHTDRESLIWLLSWAVLMVVRALPSAPGHDVERQFLPSMLSLAVLSGLGAGWLGSLLRPHKLQWLAAVLACGAWGESWFGIAQLYPYTLSYYNFALGGLPGAERRGFELTYYWDTMGPEFLRWVKDKSEREPVELRFPSDLINIRFLREWGALPKQVPVVGLENTQEPYYVLQRRQGLFYPYDWWLERHGDPCFSTSRQGVDLLRVYPYQESYRAYQATRNIPPPEHLRH